MDYLSELLLISLALPILGAVAIGIAGPTTPKLARGIALLTTLINLVVAGYVTCAGSKLTGEYAVTNSTWITLGKVAEINFHVGLDGLSLWMYGLAALLSVTAVLVSWTAITTRQTGLLCLAVDSRNRMLGVFAAKDLLLFYIFFEFTLIPLFFLIGVWGSEERRYAAVKFFLFTLAGSLLTFIALLATVLYASKIKVDDKAVVQAKESTNATEKLVDKVAPKQTITFSIPELTKRLQAQPLPADVQWWIFLGLFAGFAIKVPLFPLHTWLPLAHVQAPTAGSVLLAGILLKIGTYGFVRFNLPWLPDATVAWMPFILTLSVAGIIYGALSHSRRVTSSD